MATSKTLIIPAAGSGTRMQRERAKPFIELGSQPILAHTIQRFLSLAGLSQILIAAAAEYIQECSDILQEVVGNSISWQCVEGGAERQDSINNALQHVADVDLVLVHDAVRPFVTANLIEACCRQAERTGAAIPGIPSKDTLKKIDDDRLVQQTPDRKYMWQVQTPQVFKKEILVKAYARAAQEKYVGTDDASLVEWLGKPVKMVKSDTRNIKITYPQDLKLANLLLNDKAFS